MTVTCGGAAITAVTVAAQADTTDIKGTFLDSSLERRHAPMTIAQVRASLGTVTATVVSALVGDVVIKTGKPDRRHRAQVVTDDRHLRLPADTEARLNPTSTGACRIVNDFPMTVPVPLLNKAGPTLSDNTASTNDYFIVVSAPTVDATDPFSGDTGGTAGHQFTLKGTNFQGITSVTFGRVQAQFQPVVTGGVIDTTKLRVTVPSGTLSSTVTVANAAGSKTTKQKLTVLAISKASPTSGKVGTFFSILGSGFKPGSGLATVTIGGDPAVVAPTSTDTSLKVTVPSKPPATYTVVVTDSLGTASTTFQIKI
jgi:IPT/TIG domain